jgi:hypothetical protein
MGSVEALNICAGPSIISKASAVLERMQKSPFGVRGEFSR